MVFGSIAFYYGFLAAYTALPPGALNIVGKSDNAYWVAFEVRCSASSLYSPTLHVGLHSHRTTQLLMEDRLVQLSLLLA